LLDGAQSLSIAALAVHEPFAALATGRNLLAPTEQYTIEREWTNVISFSFQARLLHQRLQ
jgi:hypothetical protein